MPTTNKIMIIGIVMILLISGCSSIDLQTHPCEQPYTLNLSCKDVYTCVLHNDFHIAKVYYEEKCQQR